MPSSSTSRRPPPTPPSTSSSRRSSYQGGLHIVPKNKNKPQQQQQQQHRYRPSLTFSLGTGAGSHSRQTSTTTTTAHGRMPSGVGPLSGGKSGSHAGASGGPGMPRIRRPRKILYLLLVFGLLYWCSLRHGLGQERALSHFEQLRAERLAKQQALVRAQMEAEQPWLGDGSKKGVKGPSSAGAGAPHAIGGAAVRPPIRVVGAAKQVGSGGGAGEIWENTIGRLGLGSKGKSKSSKSVKPQHVFRDDGQVEVREGDSAEHPIYDLMERARASFDGMLSRQSRTLARAAQEYRQRYGMDPPRGFDAWWKFVVDEDIKIVDDYDRIWRDIAPFHALTPKMFRERAEKLKKVDFTWTFKVTHDAITASGPRADASRPKSLKDMIDGFRHRLPADFEAEFTGSDHDLGSWVLGEDQRERALELVSEGKHFEQEELARLQDMKRTPVKGWFSACSLDSPANAQPDAENAPDAGSTRDDGLVPKTFIHEHQSTMDFCQHPSLKRLHGALSLDYPGRTPSELRPLFVLSKFANNAEILQTPLQAYRNLSDLNPTEFLDWSEKTINRVFWRGSSTGGFNVQRPWQDSHRMRLHLMINGKKDGAAASSDIDDSAASRYRPVMMPDGSGGFEMVPVDASTLAKAYTDIGLSGKPHQCESTGLCDVIASEIEFKGRVTPADGAKYKCESREAEKAERWRGL